MNLSEKSHMFPRISNCNKACNKCYPSICLLQPDIRSDVRRNPTADLISYFLDINQSDIIQISTKCQWASKLQIQFHIFNLMFVCIREPPVRTMPDAIDSLPWVISSIANLALQTGDSVSYFPFLICSHYLISLATQRRGGYWKSSVNRQAAAHKLTTHKQTNTETNKQTNKQYLWPLRGEEDILEILC